MTIQLGVHPGDYLLVREDATGKLYRAVEVTPGYTLVRGVPGGALLPAQYWSLPRNGAWREWEGKR